MPPATACPSGTTSSSPALRGRRIQSTSIGAPMSSTCKAGPLAERRVASVGADDERRRRSRCSARPASARPRRSTRSPSSNRDRPPRPDIIRRNSGTPCALSARKFEEVPLRHQRDEPCRERRQVAEVGEHGWCRRRPAPASSLQLGGAGSFRKSSSRPSSHITSSVEGCTVSPRKSRRKSACFSSTMTRRRRGPAGSPASCRPVRRRRCSRWMVRSVSGRGPAWRDSSDIVADAVLEAGELALVAGAAQPLEPASVKYW